MNPVTVNGVVYDVVLDALYLQKTNVSPFRISGESPIGECVRLRRRLGDIDNSDCIGEIHLEDEPEPRYYIIQRRNTRTYEFADYMPHSAGTSRVMFHQSHDVTLVVSRLRKLALLLT